jgi:type III restriction enzyme
VQIPSNDASVRYRQWIDAGIAKWRDYWTDLQKSGKKPVLFVMTEDTRSADDIRDYLETLPDLKNHVLTIHTDKKGEITKKELDDARKASREVDSDQNPYRVIVSVLMLREGWDVRNVVVIVPLRPYTAKANILPEQTLGRCLRRMTGPGSGFEERVIVVEHDAFRDFWDKEIKEEGLEIERDRLENVRIDIKTIIVESTKLEFDIEIPQLSPVLSRSVTALKNLDLDKIPKRTISLPSD